MNDKAIAHGCNALVLTQTIGGHYHEVCQQCHRCIDCGAKKRNGARIGAARRKQQKPIR